VRVAVRRVLPGSLVLLYHRVALSERDPWRLCTSPRHFAEHLEVLRGRVCRLAELPETGASGRVAISFDDGYADALLAARPLLEKVAAPATVFVTTGGPQDGRPFWWDELEDLLAPSRALPQRLALCIRGSVHRFELGGPDARERLSLALHRLLGALEGEERREPLEALRAWAGAEASVAACSRALDREELGRLAAGDLVEIGAHTVSHPRLPELAFAAQEREIRGSHDFLAELLGRRPTSFAYPHGLQRAATRRIVRETGFERACTSAPGVVRSGTDPLRLPRVEAPDCDGESFARWLHGHGFAL
jgi:peptidoglycan/xylan/chitin deacetylase (PgdA/CDA1 family)